MMSKDSVERCAEVVGMEFRRVDEMHDRSQETAVQVLQLEM
jgi:hypothetical protein